MTQATAVQSTCMPSLWFREDECTRVFQSCADRAGWVSTLLLECLRNAWRGKAGHRYRSTPRHQRDGLNAVWSTRLPSLWLRAVAGAYGIYANCSANCSAISLAPHFLRHRTFFGPAVSLVCATGETIQPLSDPPACHLFGPAISLVCAPSGPNRPCPCVRQKAGGAEGMVQAKCRLPSNFMALITSGCG